MTGHHMKCLYCKANLRTIHRLDGKLQTAHDGGATCGFRITRGGDQTMVCPPWSLQSHESLKTEWLSVSDGHLVVGSKDA